MTKKTIAIRKATDRNASSWSMTDTSHAEKAISDAGITARNGGTSHQAERSVSCTLRTLTASVGMSTANARGQMKIEKGRQIRQKAANHQNSDRWARPLKLAYFLKQVLIDSAKVI
ncbi:MAG: hypothetical protein OXR64_01435 [Chloroflexota bacterium]|nr:hypothetical protein [Chloroflexota bacterium]MDE2918491.1 hypothetical protein [Chloroflexota bacterium]